MAKKVARKKATEASVGEVVDAQEVIHDDDPEALDKVGREARSALGNNSAKIVGELTKHALEGNCTSVQLLLRVAIAGKQFKKKKGPSPALLLEAEPEWKNNKKEEAVAVVAA